RGDWRLKRTMKGKDEIRDTVKSFCQGMMAQLAEEYGTDYEGLKAKWLEIHEIYLETVNSFLEQWAENQSAAGSREAEPQKISAHQVVLEITDRDTGIICRR